MDFVLSSSSSSSSSSSGWSYRLVFIITAVFLHAGFLSRL